MLLAGCASAVHTRWRFGVPGFAIDFLNQKNSETKVELVSNNHTTVKQNMKNMKSNTEMNVISHNDAASAVAAGALRRAKTLKVTVVILSLTALGLSYRAASEAMALYGVLEKVQATLAQEQIIKAQVASSLQISETKHSIAGL